ncbi:hypothetical protein SAMN06295905_2831 [Devosia lucknowensis]|uniref:Phage integrase family protein n=1 Tax=Devosia lucknowensis TaxID=1096929 RepID=A0A1Y6G5V3_9HYPH|nr:site-specific integrase [Devosia lucknowensis]SMQ85551.1 hypothetical protein SAMN06295905_2831 [Devosia lucknowensis]
MSRTRISKERQDWKIDQEAMRFLKRAEELRKPGENMVEALIREAGSPAPIIGSSLRNYRHSYKRALKIVGSSNIDADFALLNEQLETRRALRREIGKRTSAKKHKDVTQKEAKATFIFLKASALKHESRTAMAAALFTCVMPHVALRPIELLTADVFGDEIRVMNAKAKPGQLRYRRISLKRFAPTFIEAVRWLCILTQSAVPDDPDLDAQKMIDAWYSRLAECLAYASEKAGGRRLAPYSFRHCGIATWKNSGFSQAEIAALAGHLNLDTANKHYAGASKGWRMGAAVALPVSSEPVVATADADAHQHHQQGSQQEHRVISETDENVLSAKPTMPLKQMDRVFEVEAMPRPIPANNLQKGKRAVQQSFEAKANAISEVVQRIARSGTTLPGHHYVDGAVASELDLGD